MPVGMSGLWAFVFLKLSRRDARPTNMGIVAGKTGAESPDATVLFTGDEYEIRRVKETRNRQSQFRVLANYIGLFGQPRNTKREVKESLETLEPEEPMENTAWLPDSKEVKEMAPEVHESKTTPDLEPQTQQDTQVICEDGVCSVDTPDKQEVKNPIETFLRFGSIKKGTQPAGQDTVEKFSWFGSRKQETRGTCVEAKLPSEKLSWLSSQQEAPVVCDEDMCVEAKDPQEKHSKLGNHSQEAQDMCDSDMGMEEPTSLQKASWLTELKQATQALLEPVPQTSLRMDMTAPVITIGYRRTNTRVMMFTLPLRLKSFDEIPEPMNKSITIARMPERVLAVRTFSGLASNSSVRYNLRQLLVRLHADGWIASNEEDENDWELAQYHPPFTVPPARVNEIWIMINPNNERFLQLTI